MAEAHPEPRPALLSVDDARRRVIEICAAHPSGTEVVPLESVRGRVLAIDVAAPFDVPGFANSAMDGFALRGDELRADAVSQFKLAGEIFAGRGVAPRVVPGCCVRVTTGAPLPDGADTVVMKENARVDADIVHVEPGTQRGANVRPAGEDYRRGDLAVQRGTRLAAAHAGALASFGMTGIAV